MFLTRLKESNNYDHEQIKQYWCTSYAMQRAKEICGSYPTFKDRKVGGFPNACNWFTTTTLEKGEIARCGAIACWKGGEYGHVAIVEECQKNHIKISQANSKKTFFLSEHDVEVGKENNELGKGYIFQGFIYLDNVNDIRVDRNESKLQVEIFADTLRVRKAPEGSYESGLYCPKGVYNCEIIGEWAKLEDEAYVMLNSDWNKVYGPEESINDIAAAILDLAKKLNKSLSKFEKEYEKGQIEIDRLTDELKTANEKLDKIKEII